MQWNLITNNNLPEPGQQVLGLWLDGFWKKLAFSAREGWYTSRDGVEPVPPTWWAHVESRPPKVSEVGEVGPVGEEGPLGPDASVMERVRKFLEQLIEVRDHYSADLELKLPPEYCGKYECYDDWAADKAAELLKMISLLPAAAPEPTDAEYLLDLSARLFTASSPLTDQADCDTLNDIAARLADDAGES